MAYLYEIYALRDWDGDWTARPPIRPQMHSFPTPSSGKSSLHESGIEEAGMEVGARAGRESEGGKQARGGFRAFLADPGMFRV